jgi:hypothetical protein
LREAKVKLGIDFELMEQREAKRSKMPKTDIVCKYFLDAVKIRIYGYKWQCPNGDECHYKHCLPKDYIIKTLQEKTEEEMTIEEFHDLEEKIDVERERLSLTGTKLTDKTFMQWKDRRLKEKEKTLGYDKKAELLKKLKTGRELFIQNNDAYIDDENADDDVYENQNNELEEETRALQQELWNTEVKVDTELFKEEGDLDEVNLEEENEDEEEGVDQ